MHWADGEGMRADSVPEVLVISLERLPSHGRAVAKWLWSAQYRRAIPWCSWAAAPTAWSVRGSSSATRCSATSTSSPRVVSGLARASR